MYLNEIEEKICKKADSVHTFKDAIEIAHAAKFLKEIGAIDKDVCDDIISYCMDIAHENCKEFFVSML